jgi:hypothetical protein
MTLANRNRMRAALLGLLVALPCVQADAGDTGAAAWQQQLAAARASYYAGLEGDRAADAVARERFASLEREHPHDATLQAYSGSLELLEAGRTWALWRKHTLSTEGLQQMDSAVNADPNNLEARFVRAFTTWHLPFFFHRKQQAEADLLFLGPRAEGAARSGALPPQLAAAALDYWGQVLADRDQGDAARHAFVAAVRVDRSSPGGADALKHLHE